MLEIAILSLFPEYFRGPFETSILKRALQEALSVQLVNVRDFATSKHSRVDDRPYGGGPGMVMMPGPLTSAIESVRRKRSRVIYLSPQGTPLTAKKARELAEQEHLVLLCGHYEGVDQRVLDREVDEEISIGDYVLTNGCLPAIVLIDAVARFIPGVLGHEEAANQDTFENGIFDCPHYTRPDEFLGQRVPQVLVEGNHQKIAAWRRAEALRKTEQVRPELYQRYMVNLKGKGETKASPLSVSGVAAVRLPVTDLRRSLEFYKGLLGLRVNHKGDGYVSVDLGNLELLLVEAKLAELEGASPLFEVEINEARLFDGIAQKVLEQGRIHYGSRQREEELLETLTVELRDPDGYHFCLTCKQNRNKEQE